MMQINSLRAQLVRIPLRVRFAQANQDTRRSSSVVLHLHTQSGIHGYGEACPRRYVTGEDSASVLADLERIRPKLKARRFQSWEGLRAYLENELPLEVGLATSCALELALLDAWGKIKSRPVNRLLGALGTRQPLFSGVLPMASGKAFEALLERLAPFEFPAYKLKVNQDLTDSLHKIHQIRARFGADCPIRLDANTSWDLDTAYQQIPAFLKAGVSSFEQIFPQGQERALARITAIFGQEATIMADESLTSYASARRLVELGSCNHFNLKLSKHGGILASLRIARLSAQQGIPCQLGAHFGETSILTAAGLHFAAAAPPLSAREGGLGTHLLKQDLVADSLKIGRKGRLDWKPGPGLGLGEVKVPTSVGDHVV